MNKIVLMCALIVGAFSFGNLEVTYANPEVEEEVRIFFEGIPVMIEIARCESKFSQFTATGSVLKGGWGNGMVGVFQIYESVHASAAQKLGFDITTLEGNLGYAKHLYTRSGTTPWNSSKTCWQHAVSAQTKANTKELEKKIAELKKLVAQLERLLALKKTV